VKLMLAAILSAAALLSAAPAGADPSYDPACGQQARCSYGPPRGPGLVFCPDTGGFVNEFHGSCPSLWVGGPYLPGGLVPNGGSGDR
jgi:hypothetical protein